MTRFSILTTAPGSAACCIYHLPDALALPLAPARGEPVGAIYPDGLAFPMAPEVPCPRVTDVIHNALGYLMITERTKELLEAYAVAQIEYLRFTLVNHKGRVASDRCYIANVLGTVDCADLARTRGTPHPFFPSELYLVNELVLDESRIPPDVNLLRLATRPRIILIRDDLRQILVDAGITGAIFLEQGAVMP